MKERELAYTIDLDKLSLLKGVGCSATLLDFLKFYKRSLSFSHFLFSNCSLLVLKHVLCRDF